jgi:branched-chain amino acid transport system permease protein
LRTVESAGVLRRYGGSVFALALALAYPKLAIAFGHDFYVSFGSRLLIMALLASSLNLLVGVGGMVSLGHAAFYGFGAYAVGIVAAQWAGTAAEHALIAWPLAMLVSGALALAIGAISLRTRGVYFIMITLAFAQMLYYVFVSLKAFGGDDGFSLAKRSGMGGLDLGSDVTFYYVVLVVFAAALVFLGRLDESRFGVVLRGIKDNEVRMESLGFATYRFKLTAFVIAGAMAGLAGALMANQNSFVSPNMMHWEQSGVALVMVVLGGLGSLWGGLAGAAAFLVLEEVLSGFTRHWQIALGGIMLGVVFFAPRGVAGLFSVKR